MRIAHFYAKCANLGDKGSALGIQTILRSIRGDIEFVEFNVQSRNLSWLDARRLGREFDALMVGGGGLLYNRPKRASKFYLNLSLPQYKRLSLPKCFFGVGLNAEHSQDQRWRMTDDTRESIRLFLGHADLIGVRDYHTVSFLKDLDVPNVMLTACPSMFLLYDMEASGREAILAINLTKRTIGLDRVRMVLEHLRSYAERATLTPVFVAHHPDEDRECMEVAREVGIEAYLPSSPENLMQFYKRCFVLVGMRGHSMIYGTGASLPMVAISYNVKCDAHMSMIGLDGYVIKADRLGDKDLLVSKLDRLLSNRDDIEAQLTQKKAKLYQLDREFANKWISLVESRGAG